MIHSCFKKKLLRLFTCTLTFASLSAFSAAPALAQTDVHVLDVGQGLSVLVESQGHAMLYDGGDRNKSSFVVSYLKQQGITSLDYMIASHYDSDHINGLTGVLNTTEIKQVFAPEYTTDTRVFQSLQSAIASKSIPKEQPAVGSSYPLGDAVIQVLAPSGTSYSDVNNYSIAIRITDGDTSFLITGDAEAESEAEICRTGLPLESDVYVMGHHGSGTSTSWELLQKAVPEYAVLSCGAGNSYGHPHVESMEKLEAMDISLFRTDKQGTIIASTDGSSLTWNVSPCNDYTPGDKNDTPAQPQRSASSAADSATGSVADSAVGSATDSAVRSATDSASSAAASTSSAAADTQTSDVGTEYILNISTKKFHYPGCRSVAQMKETNKKSVSESRDSLISQGYSPCGNCKP